MFYHIFQCDLESSMAQTKVLSKFYEKEHNILDAAAVLPSKI